MALLAFATFVASVASAQTYSGKITSSDWSGDKRLESDVDYSLTYIESTKKLNFEFTVPCDKKIINAYFFAEHGFGETKIEVPQSVDGTYTLSGTTGGAFVFDKGHETWFFLKLTIAGVGDIVTNHIAYKAGEENTAKDTEAPEWGVDPVVEKVTDKTAEIVVNVTDDSGSAVITLTGDNGFAELKKEVKADGTDQTIALNGLTANTTYNLTLAIADAAGNAGESKTVNFTTLETPDREVLYHSFNFTSENWTKRGDSNTFAPNGNILLTVNADNTVTFKVTVDEGAETVDNAWVILHGIDDTFRINAQEDGSFVGTSTKSISNREASQAFHLNFVLKGVAKNSELAVMYFTPSKGSTSAVAEVETEAAKVVAANGVIRVEGDKTFAVYTVAGQLAFRGMGEVRLDKGVYVVVVDGKAQKVML